MHAIEPSPAPVSILIVVVLYKCEFAKSQALTSILQILKTDPELADHFSLILYDNSPERLNQNPVGTVPLLYVHDPSNSGLAVAYNFALARAELQGSEWILLFDQDTKATRKFLLELVVSATNLRDVANVAAIVPKLLVNGIVHSPATHFLDVLRRQFSTPAPNTYNSLVGIQEDRLNFYNSASTLRVSTLRSIGAFPTEFWLDYLDHTVFHTLFVNGYRVYVLNASLEHDQSDADLTDVSALRHRNVLRAQTLFVKRAGNLVDRTLYRVWLLRYSRKLRSLCKDRRVWRETALQALRLRIGTPSATSEKGPTIVRIC